MNLTAEQKDIVNHNLAKHATVLAVAGSGKTQTMVHRIKFLLEKGVPSNAIRAVMYNRSAREDFERKLGLMGLGDVKVSTFHSFGYNILLWANKHGYAPDQVLIEDARPLVKRVIKELRDQGVVSKDQIVDSDEALDAISTWKSMLTLPIDATHLVQPIFEEVYARFEEIRHRERLLTFDDMIFDAVLLLEANSSVHDRMANHLEHLIIDEFQDVNLIRLKLAQIIAGETAKVMVVGDDDQCIYEWQGARSSFIKRGFATMFTTFPHSSYKLSRSFRFGPTIAQVAANVIGHNSDRVEKDLVAHNLAEKGLVELHDKPVAGGERQVVKVLKELFQKGARPTDVVVLVRKFAQSFPAQRQMIQNRIPFFVDGPESFLKGFAIQLALDYLDLAISLDRAIRASTLKQLVEVANRPMRYVNKAKLAEFLNSCLATSTTISQILSDGYSLREAGMTDNAASQLSTLARVLRNAALPEGSTSGAIIRAIMNKVDFKSAFSAFQNDADADDEVERMNMLAMLLDSANIKPEEARKYLKSLDTTLGKKEEECIRVTSTFRAKGLEWDYVLLPGLVEGHCPDLRATVNVCVNRSDPDRTLSPTETLESERRLFYVAVTRARKEVYLFADPTKARLISRFIPEATIGPTVHSIQALHQLGRGAPDTNRWLGILEKYAQQDLRLREGVLKMLRRMSNDNNLANDIKGALSKATYVVNTSDPAPFTYPQAYPDTPRVIERKGRIEKHEGLPF